MAAGSGGQLALTRIGSLYTSVNCANVWTNFKSETLEHKLNELQEGSITGNHDTPPSHKGLDFGAGDLSVEPNPNALSYFVKGWFGTSTHSTVTAAGSTGANSTSAAGVSVFHHRFTPRASAFSALSFLDPHNVMIYRDVGSAWLFKGAVFPTLKFDIAAGQLLNLGVSGIMARQVDRIERIAAINSLVSGGGRPWTWDMASVEISTSLTSAALVAAPIFEKLSMTFECPIEGVPLLDGTKLYAEFPKNGFRSVKFDGTASFRDQNEYDAFKAYEARRMRITFLHVASSQMLGNPASLSPSGFLGYYGLRFHFPQMLYTSWGAPISGPNRLTVTFNARALYDETEGTTAVLEMVNLVSSTAINASY